MVTLYVTNPQTGRKIVFASHGKGSKTQYQKLEAAGILKFADVVIENLMLPWTIRPGLVLTTLLARSNSPVYATNIPGQVVKIGNVQRSDLYREWVIRRYLPEDVAPTFYEWGEIKQEGQPLFGYLLMEQLDYTLESRRFLFTPEEMAKLVVDTCYIFQALEQARLAYNDYKPGNVMFSRSRNRWLLIDLESITDYGPQAAPEHTITYTPSAFIGADRVVADSFTDAESVAYTLYDVWVGLPWFGQHNPDDVVRMRRAWTVVPPDAITQFIYWLYQGSQTPDRTEPINWPQINQIFREVTGL